jgi:hypothetical protein
MRLVEIGKRREINEKDEGMSLRYIVCTFVNLTMYS